MGFWWPYRDFDRDADVVARRMASYIKMLSTMTDYFSPFYEYVCKIVENGILQKKLEKEAFTSGINFFSDGKVDIISFSGSYRYGQGEPDWPGRVELKVNQTLRSAPELLHDIFWNSIDYWDAGEAGLYSVTPAWEFKWRWQRADVAGQLRPKIPLAPGWIEQVERCGGTLYVYSDH